MYERNEKTKQRAAAEGNIIEEGSVWLVVQLWVVKMGQAPSVLAYSTHPTLAGRYSLKHTHIYCNSTCLAWLWPPGTASCW